MKAGGSVTELAFYRLSGQVPGFCVLIGTVTLVAGSETIDPGNNDTNFEGSGSLRRFLRWGLENQTAGRAPQVQSDWNATQQGDRLTITGTGTDTYAFWIEGIDSGADVT